MTGEKREDPPPLAEELVATLTRRGLTIAVVESLTGGLLASAIVDVPGASAVFTGGVVTYATELKGTVLGVDPVLLATRGAVDPEVARQMAEGVRRRLGLAGAPASIGVATTGVAGPDPQDGEPPGTVYVGVATETGVRAHRVRFEGDREAIRHAAVSESLAIVLATVTE